MDLICCWNKNKVGTRKCHIIPPNERYVKFMNSVIKEKTFDVAKTLHYGYFGASLMVKDNETKEEVKVRILKEEYVGENELEWAKLNHSNLQHLLKLEYIKSTQCYLFYTVGDKTTLEDKMSDKSFRKDTEALWKLVYWLEGVADALQYLHVKGYGHLNLQAKSMIISKDDVIQISEFHHLSLINSRIDTFGFPQALRCPEAFLNYGGTWPVKPGPFDSWSLGILIIELFTDFYLSKKITKKVTTWTKQAYPIIFDVLKKYKFNRLVRKAFPKAYGTVDLKTIRYLTAYTLAFDPSQRPSAKQLHNLFVMLNIQKNFFSKIHMEFQKDKIWEKKFEWKKFQKHFSKLSTKDNLELLREDNLRKSGVQRESSLNSRSVPRNERDFVAEEPPTKAGDKIGSGPEKLDRLTISNIKQQSKKEKQVFLKTEHRIKMAYTAYTFHDTSAFETSVVDLKSGISDLPGVSSDKTSTSSSEIEKLQKNIENSRMYIGDASPIRQVEQFQTNIQNSSLPTLDTSTQSKIHNELQENEKDIGSNSEVDSGMKSTDGCEKEIKSGQHFFSIGKQFVNRLIKWGISGYEMTSYNYELTSSKNRLHTLSKNLTK